MANVLMATQQAASSTMGVVSTTARTVESAVSAAGKYVSTLEVHADMYHKRTVRMMQIDEEGAIQRAIQTKALDDAAFYVEKEKQLEANPLMQEHYDAAIKRYNQSLHTDQNPTGSMQIAAE